MTLSERDWQRTVIAAARALGWRVMHSRPAMNRRGRWSTPLEGDPGFVDLVLARDGDVIHAELKRDDGKLTPDQELWLAALGGMVWRPKDWPAVEARLKRREGRKAA